MNWCYLKGIQSRGICFARFELLVSIPNSLILVVIFSDVQKDPPPRIIPFSSAYPSHSIWIYQCLAKCPDNAIQRNEGLFARDKLDNKDMNGSPTNPSPAMKTIVEQK